ncbi:MAG: hypothetical protein ABR511_08140 [Acidimicrobiales bacterium]
MRPVVAALAAIAAIVVAAPAASAHEEITPATVATGVPVFFTLSAANEKSADLTGLALASPAGVSFGATTRSPPGWTVKRTDATVTWSGGAVRPDTFEQWGFEIEGADQPGTLTWNLTMSYADGSSDQVQVDVTAAAPATATGRAAASSGSSATGGADGALAVGVAALVAALVALGLAVGARRGRPSASEGEAQDW